MSQSRFLQDESQDELKRLERNSLSLSIAGTAIALMAGIAALVFKFTNLNPFSCRYWVVNNIDTFQ